MGRSRSKYLASNENVIGKDPRVTVNKISKTEAGESRTAYIIVEMHYVSVIKTRTATKV